MRIACLFLFIFATLVRHSFASCGGNGEYLFDDTSNTSKPTNLTEFQENLDGALDQLPTNETKISLYSYAGVDWGVDPNAAYTQARCIGYVDFSTCHNCIKDTTTKLKHDCSMEAPSVFLLYNDYCMMQYSNHDMSGILQMRDDIILITNNTADVEPSLNISSFNEARMKLFDTLASETEGIASSEEKVSVGKRYDGSSNMTIYGAVACSWDLSSDDCGTCLNIVNRKLGENFDGKVGGSIVGPTCNFRFEIYNFITDTLLVVNDFSPPLPPPSSSTGEGANKALLAIYILVPLLITSIIVFTGIYLFLRKKKLKKHATDFEIVEKISDDDESTFDPGMKTEETLQYDFVTISAATENFSEANTLGEGGFGPVFKGNLPNGDEIAVKRLSQTSRQGEVEFKNEVTLLANLQHRNLVRLLGFCLERKERLLIYEFVANSSLDNFIFDPIKRAHLNWDRLYKIIGGVARGLLYLHEDSRLRIIHRDLKGSNILLDNEMTPKIADFGLARLFLSDETHGNTSKIVGTYGYMAPEYAMHGKFSFKSDVFSFGVLLLEIVCGRRNTFFRIENSVEDLLSYAWKNWKAGTIINLLDPALRLETSSTREMTRCIHIGLLCAQEDDKQRPTMASVFNLLSNLSIALPVPSKPAFFQQRSINQETPLLQN